ncbi:peptidylprolyl isomerase [Maricaulaceae bacterium EIL42A08]|nr:peptidylprolyl isomerase [Maricaulaceae bacterium EIL42A08]
MSVNQAPLRLMAFSIVAGTFLTACGGSGTGSESTAQTPETSVSQSLHFTEGGPNEGERVAARVGNTVITSSDVYREAVSRELIAEGDTLAEDDPLFQDALTELIDQRLLALEAANRGLDADPEARRRLAAAEERILGNILVETAISRSVTDEAVRRVYEEQARLAPRVEEVRARHILVDTREEAEEALRVLEDGVSFTDLVSRISQDPATRFNGGDLGYFTWSGIVPGFADMAFSTAEGEVSAPFETEYGWHILTVIDRRNQPRASLESMRANIVRFLTLQEIDDLVSRLREDYPVVIEAGTLPEGLRTDGPDDDAAEEETAPDAP